VKHVRGPSRSGAGTPPARRWGSSKGSSARLWSSADYTERWSLDRNAAVRPSRGISAVTRTTKLGQKRQDTKERSTPPVGPALEKRTKAKKALKNVREERREN